MNTANKLTILRILLIPVFLVVLYWGFKGSTYVALAIFIIASITDIADGILVLVDAGDHSACLLADSLIGKFQVVVKPLPSYLNRFDVKRSGISGCTIMGNGNISLIINVQEMVE